MNKEYIDENKDKIPSNEEKKGKVSKLYNDLDDKKIAQDKAYQTAVDRANHKNESLGFNTNEPAFVRNEDYKRQIDKLLDTPELKKDEFSSARIALEEQSAKLEQANIQMQLDHANGKYVSELNKGQFFSPDAVIKGEMLLFVGYSKN
jgi:hypothetical protein